MSEYTPTVGLGEILDDVVAQAMEDWRKAHSPSTPARELLSGPLTSLEVHATVFPGGRATAIITARGWRPWDDEVYMHRLQRKTNGKWRIALST